MFIQTIHLLLHISDGRLFTNALITYLFLFLFLERREGRKTEGERH